MCGKQDIVLESALGSDIVTAPMKLGTKVEFGFILYDSFYPRKKTVLSKSLSHQDTCR